ncbi:hypothetical protein TpMuguga_04g00118 [Theileria parva strain Muguga]|uniref:Uncharacterized protein n=1 Tax=Theileria parva TaxID=5875 RepID=Q4N369_THEPA|nr:uncharacterized protein TpMuguga_04g00118 [Theileria parva strain Muguga]EAN31470.1 hypothetical protein TpMuguga_04g00118 [Theileria parva strain Muguga]|eukprot:XP_763753.1 hypothetical protein [Theileria parva strain Muguga]
MLEKVVVVGKSGVHVLDSNARIDQTIANESMLSEMNGCVMSSSGLCVSLLEKAKLVFISHENVFRASVPEMMTSITCTNEGEILFCGSKSGKLYVWHLREGNLLYCEQIFYNEVTDVKLDPLESSLLLSSSNGDLSLVKLVDLFTNDLHTKHFLGHTTHILSVCNKRYGLDSVDFLSVSRDKNLRLWRENSTQSVKSFQLQSNPLKLYSYRGTYLLCDDGNLVIINLKEFTLQYVKLHPGPVYSFLEVGNQFISCSFDGIRVWDSHFNLISLYNPNLSINQMFTVKSIPRCNYKQLLKLKLQNVANTIQI